MIAGRPFTAIFAALAAFAGQSNCTPPPAAAVGNESSLREMVAAGTLADLRWPKFPDQQAPVATFYEAGNYELAWTRDGTATDQARSLINAFSNAATRGLDPEDYDGSRWAPRLTTLRPANAQPTDGDLARFDLALTVSAMRYISDVHVGKVDPKLFGFGLNVEPKKLNLPEVLRARVMNGSDVPGVLDQFEPALPSYRRLRDALHTYATLAPDDDGELLPVPENPVEVGKPYEGVPRLERLLRRLGDLPANATVDTSLPIYQAPLAAAVKRFQVRHGLFADGALGKTTIKQLNLPLSARVRQLQLAMERSRWEPDVFSRPRVIVNIPEFRLTAFDEKGQPELEMKVVVGKSKDRQTPVFAARITHLIFRPYWNVPISIQKTEIVPAAARDGHYLEKNDYEVVNWRGEVQESTPVSKDMLRKLTYGQYSVRQTPGPKNALGPIKFVLANEYDVYLHGTPARGLFWRPRRDFSHGCIRLEKPEDLAAWALKSRKEWTPARILEAVGEDEETSQVYLDKAFPVMVLYSTAVVREKGEVQFFDDIYGHDAALAEVLDKGYPYSDWKPAKLNRNNKVEE